MSDDWMDAQISDGPDEGSDTDSGEVKLPSTDVSPEDFARKLRTLLARDSLDKMDVAAVESHVDTLDDSELLERAVNATANPAMKDLFADRLDSLDTDIEEPDEPEESEPSTDGGSGLDTSGMFDEDEATGEAGAEKNALEALSEDVTEEPETLAESDADMAEDVEENAEMYDALADMPDDEDEPTTAYEDADVPVEERSDTPDESEADDTGVDIKSIAPEALTVEEAAAQERRWSVLVWGNPGLGKSHLGMSAPEPVVVIDTEGKANELAHKFRGTGRYEQSPIILQPSDYDEVLDALEKAIRLLDEFRDVYDVMGTIVVDSMSVMWEWAQQKYVDKYYPDADAPADVEFKTGFSKGRSDWKVIKKFHNTRFRQVLIDCPYHLVWTAMRTDDYESQFEGDTQADKPAGEKNNIYKVDEIIRLREGSDGAPIGELQKSGKIKHRYTGLRYPTFEKHRDIVEAIDEAEAGRGTIDGVAKRFDVRIVEGNPAYLRGESDE